MHGLTFDLLIKKIMRLARSDRCFNGKHSSSVYTYGMSIRYDDDHRMMVKTFDFSQNFYLCIAKQNFEILLTRTINFYVYRRFWRHWLRK